MCGHTPPHIHTHIVYAEFNLVMLTSLKNSVNSSSSKGSQTKKCKHLVVLESSIQHQTVPFQSGIRVRRFLIMDLLITQHLLKTIISFKVRGYPRPTRGIPMMLCPCQKFQAGKQFLLTLFCLPPDLVRQIAPNLKRIFTLIGIHWENECLPIFLASFRQ